MKQNKGLLRQTGDLNPSKRPEVKEKKRLAMLAYYERRRLEKMSV